MPSCDLLLKAGAALHRKNRQKETVLDYAIKYESAVLKVKYEALLEAK